MSFIFLSIHSSFQRKETTITEVQLKSVVTFQHLKDGTYEMAWCQDPTH